MSNSWKILKGLHLHGRNININDSNKAHLLLYRTMTSLLFLFFQIYTQATEISKGI